MVTCAAHGDPIGGDAAVIVGHDAVEGAHVVGLLDCVESFADATHSLGTTISTVTSSSSIVTSSAASGS